MGVLIGQLAVVCYLIYFVSSFDSVDNAEVGTGDYDRWEKHGAMSDNLKSMESYICKSYQKCCRDPSLLNGGITNTEVDMEEGSNATNYANSSRINNVTTTSKQSCITLHPGMNDADKDLLTLKDPSQEGFCKMVSGKENKYVISMSEGACQQMDKEVIGFSREACQKDFCKDGIEGYNKFVHTMISMARRNMYSFALICFVLAFIQLFQVILLIKLYKFHMAQPGSKDTELQSKDVKLMDKRSDLQNRYRPQQ